MAIDKTYKKQLEAFGIEYTQIAEETLTKKQRQEFAITQANVIKTLMDNMQGREWLFSKLDAWKVFTTPFIPTDSHGTAFFSGVQACGHNLLDDIMRNSPGNFALMINEAAARDNAKKRE